MTSYAEDGDFRAQVEARFGRPFADVQEQLCELFGREWDDVEVFIATSSTKRDKDELDVIADLIAKAEEKPSTEQVMRHAVAKAIGKPWRERDNPWDRYKDKLPRTPSTKGDDDPWEPVRPEED